MHGFVYNLSKFKHEHKISRITEMLKLPFLASSHSLAHLIFESSRLTTIRQPLKNLGESKAVKNYCLCFQVKFAFFILIQNVVFLFDYASFNLT